MSEKIELDFEVDFKPGIFDNQKFFTVENEGIYSVEYKNLDGVVREFAFDLVSGTNIVISTNDDIISVIHRPSGIRLFIRKGIILV